jgi:hypothetical protein
LIQEEAWDASANAMDAHESRDAYEIELSTVSADGGAGDQHSELRQLLLKAGQATPT